MRAVCNGVDDGTAQQTNTKQNQIWQLSGANASQPNTAFPLGTRKWAEKVQEDEREHSCAYTRPDKMQAEVDVTQDTEFHDALRAHGIIPQKPPSRSPSPELPSAAEVRSQALKQATVEDLDLQLDGEVDEQEERLLDSIRRQRMAQLRQETRSARFGRVYPITRPDYTREVTEASKSSAEPAEEGEDSKSLKGTGVVCFLYKDG